MKERYLLVIVRGIA